MTTKTKSEAIDRTAFFRAITAAAPEGKRITFTNGLEPKSFNVFCDGQPVTELDDNKLMKSDPQAIAQRIAAMIGPPEAPKAEVPKPRAKKTNKTTATKPIWETPPKAKND